MEFRRAAVAARSWMGFSTFLMERLFRNRLVSRAGQLADEQHPGGKDEDGCGLGQIQPDGVGLFVPRHLDQGVAGGVAGGEGDQQSSSMAKGFVI